jgi:hypothetical protein
MKKPDIIVALDMVIGCFEKLGIAYYIGGSVASSAYGIARATMDVDLVANVEIRQVNRLVKALETDYYIDAEMIRDAIRRRTSFNLIHTTTISLPTLFRGRGMKRISNNEYQIKKCFPDFAVMTC